jgi:hypothetical protein
MKINKGAAVVALGGGIALALSGGTAMAATKAPTATLKAAHATVKPGKKIALSGKFGPEKKKVNYAAVLEEKNAKGVFVPVKGPRELITKSGAYSFIVVAGKKAGKESFEVVVDRASIKVVKHKKVIVWTKVATSKAVTVVVKK